MNEFVASHIEAAFALSVVAGAALHVAKKVIRREVGNLWAYLFDDYPGRSASVLFLLLSSIVTVIVSGELALMLPGQALLMGFTGGYFVDSFVNRGRAP